MVHTKDNNRVFDTDHLKENLGQRSVRGGVVTFIGQGTKFFLQLGSTMVLARTLTPDDFGLIAMVAAVTGFILIFKDLGLSMATVQKAEINHGQISTLFWINVAISSGLMLLAMALAPAVGWFYNKPELTWVTVALAPNLIFGGLTVQHQALLRRQMRFTALAVIDTSSMAAGVATGVVCGLIGLGYWSLVLMQLATTIATAAGVWIASGWRPGVPVRRSGVREMLAFGGYLTGFGVVNYFARNLDTILLGRYWGAQSTGLYTKAYGLLLLPVGQITSPITAVAVPTLSRLQNEPERFRNFYLKAIKLIAYTSMPLVVMMAVLSNEIVWLVLGTQWREAGPIFMVLAAAAIWQPVGATVGWIYVALGRTHRMFAWACIVTPPLALFFLLGLRWGPLGVASSYAAFTWVSIYPQFAFALKHSPVRVMDVFLSVSHPLAVATIVGLAMSIARTYLIKFGVLWTISGSLVVGGITFLLLACGLRSVWNDMREILAAAKIGL